MSIPNRIDLSTVESTFVVANTPMYLIHHLQQNASIRILGQSLSTKELLAEFRLGASRRPETLRELVAPYACLIALSLFGGIAELRESITAELRPEHKWLDYIRQVLIETYRHDSCVNVRGPNIITSPGTSLRSFGSSINFIELPKQS